MITLNEMRVGGRGQHLVWNGVAAVTNNKPASFDAQDAAMSQEVHDITGEAI